jgi:hypothetical protein
MKNSKVSQMITSSSETLASMEQMVVNSLHPVEPVRDSLSGTQAARLWLKAQETTVAST